jgi:alpha-ribazole phosphatase
MRLWLVRHARVALPEGVCYGASDVAADAQATEAAARQWAERVPPRLVVRHSPLQRCERLALSLQGLRPDLTLESDARLRELDFGGWEGRLWSAIGREAMDAWLADFAEARPGGHGESVAALMARVGAAFDDWRASERDAVWITHAGVIRAARLMAQGVRSVQVARDWPVQSVAFGEAWVLQA